MDIIQSISYLYYLLCLFVLHNVEFVVVCKEVNLGKDLMSM